MDWFRVSHAWVYSYVDDIDGSVNLIYQRPFLGGNSDLRNLAKNQDGGHPQMKHLLQHNPSSLKNAQNAKNHLPTFTIKDGCV